MMMVMKHMRDNAKASVVDIHPMAEHKWVDHFVEADKMPSVINNSIISYYTQEGTKRPGDTGYAGGGKYILYTTEAENSLNGAPPGEMFGVNPYVFEQ